MRADELEPQFSALARCLERLRPDDRRLIELRYNKNSAVAAISQEIGKSVDAVYKSLRRIHRALLDCVTAATA